MSYPSWRTGLIYSLYRRNDQYVNEKYPSWRTGLIYSLSRRNEECVNEKWRDIVPTSRDWEGK